MARTSVIRSVAYGVASGVVLLVAGALTERPGAFVRVHNEVEPAPAQGRAAAVDSVPSVDGLPIVATPPAGPRRRVLALVMSGDGGWVAVDQDLARELGRRGVGVVGLDSRAYLSRRRTPDETAGDVARILRRYLPAWGCDSVALVGYSRGADIAPFVANRLPPDLRRRVALIAMIGLAERASFEFHWTDLLSEISRPTDIPVLPELERLRGANMLCVYGTSERESLCRGVDRTLVRVLPRDGAHRVSSDEAPMLARVVMDAL
ncbi:MAG TPA: AcvB/VirJ family lysyl-phosphatidylglycerol hydrolase [Gemmatimonadaceae bacterium]|nr:AcvB/VirJ family lysyl-phosphatidylglycerol hydrolase [Gemmatimonadaceae bacterium]